MDQINHFTDLDVWKLGHKFVIEIYAITKKFPKHEVFGISSQLQRAASSITSNIAEGFSRYSFKDKIRFYYIARGSISECQNQILIARDIGYIEKETAQKLLEKAERIRQVLNGLIRSTEKQLIWT